MGGQIAIQTALCGYQVYAYDLKQEMTQKAASYAESWFAGRVKKGGFAASALHSCHLSVWPYLSTAFGGKQGLGPKSKGFLITWKGFEGLWAGFSKKF